VAAAAALTNGCRAELENKPARSAGKEMPTLLALRPMINELFSTRICNMNSLRSPTTPLLLGLVLALCLTIAGSVKAASEGSTPVAYPQSLTSAAHNPVPLAAFWNNIMGNRRRMIQVGLVAVCLGFFLLSWSRK
jgi:hypothetical protein